MDKQEIEKRKLAGYMIKPSVIKAIKQIALDKDCSASDVVEGILIKLIQHTNKAK